MLDVNNMKNWLSKNAIFEFDLETTGLDNKKDEIIQIAYMVSKGDETLLERNIKIKPFSYDKKTYDEKKFINNMLGYDLMVEKEKPEFFLPSKACEIIRNDLSRIETDSKMYVFGYNIEYDTNFLINLFNQYSNTREEHIFQYIHPERRIDVMYLLPFIEMTLNAKFKYYKLEYIRRVLKLESLDHDALEDIKTTKKLYKSFFKKLFLNN